MYYFDGLEIRCEELKGDTMGHNASHTKEETSTKTRTLAQEPSLFRVLLHNDDYTTMEFVVSVLMHVFQKTMEESTRIMLNVHLEGIGVCGIYPHEVAETKVDTVHTLARQNGFPLKCTMEKD